MNFVFSKVPVSVNKGNDESRVREHVRDSTFISGYETL